MSPMIEFTNVTLWRRTQEEFSYDLKRLLLNAARWRFGRPKRRRVLDGVSFAVNRGEKLGIVGANGSGKSTILKLISGILRPTSGRVAVRGDVAPLIELGAGFDVELSVEDNILYNGILLGRQRREMAACVDSILDFADLHEHRRIPLKALSSGMAARLGFAIATEVRPDILLVDEVLSVGDESFRSKSAERLRRIWTEHATIIIVSHDTAFVEQQCERAVWIEGGRIRAVGGAREITQAYLADVREQELAMRAGVAFAEPAVGAIDICTADADRLHVAGWVLLPQSCRRGTRVAVLARDGLVGEATYGDLRPDVAALYGEDALTAGFHADLPLAPFAHGGMLTVALYDGPNDAYHPLPTSRVAMPMPITAIIA